MQSVAEAADDTPVEADGFLLMDERLEHDALQVVDPVFVHALKRNISEVKQRDPADAMRGICYQELQPDPDYDMDDVDDMMVEEVEAARRGACRGSRGGIRGGKYRSALVQVQRRGSVHIHSQPPEEEGLLAGFRRHADEVAVIRKLRGGAGFRPKARGRPRGRGRGRGAAAAAAAATRYLKSIKALSPLRPSAVRPLQAKASAASAASVASVSRNTARRGSGTARRGSGPPSHREPAGTPSRARPDKNLIEVEVATVTLGEAQSPPLVDVKQEEAEPVAPVALTSDPPSEEDGGEEAWPCSNTSMDGQVLSEHNYLTSKPSSLSELPAAPAEASDDDADHDQDDVEDEVEDDVMPVVDATGKTVYVHRTHGDENVDVDVENDDETRLQVEPSVLAAASAPASPVPPAPATTVASTAASPTPSTTASSTTSVVASTAMCTTIPAAVSTVASSPASYESSLVVSAVTSIPAAPRDASPAPTAAPTSAPLELPDEPPPETRHPPADSAATTLSRRSPDAPERPGPKPATVWQQCQLCAVDTYSLEEFRQHMLTLHMNAQPYKCMECWKKFATAKDLIRHTDNNCKATFYKCQRCDRTWSSDVHHAECQICEVAGGENRRGQEASRYECAVCGSAFQRFGKLTSHVKIHPDVAKPYKCAPCGLLFSTSTKLMLHAKNHSPSKAAKRTAQQSPPASPPMSRPASPASSASSEGSPVRGVAGVANPFNGVSPMVSLVAVGPPVFAGPKFGHFPGNAMSSHNGSFLPTGFNSGFAGPMAGPLPVHAFATLVPNGHGRHLPRGSKVELPSEDEMDDDLDDEGDDGLADADVGGETDGDEWKMDVQDNFVIEKEDYDEKGGGSDADGMEADEGKEPEDVSRNDADEQSKPFRCPQCPKTFRLKGQVKAHMRTHTGEKPFHCFKCTKTFAVANNLKRHLMAIHKFDNEQARQAQHSMTALYRTRQHRERFCKLSNLFAVQGGMKSFGLVGPVAARPGLKPSTRGRGASHASHASLPSQRSPAKTSAMHEAAQEAAQGLLQLNMPHLQPVANDEMQQQQQQQQPKPAQETQQQESGPAPQLHQEQGLGTVPPQQQQLPRPTQPLQQQSPGCVQQQPTRPVQSVQPQQQQSHWPVQPQQLQSHQLGHIQQPQSSWPVQQQAPRPVQLKQLQPQHVQLKQISSPQPVQLKQLPSPQPVQLKQLSSPQPVQLKQLSSPQPGQLKQLSSPQPGQLKQYPPSRPVQPLLRLQSPKLDQQLPPLNQLNYQPFIRLSQYQQVQPQQLLSQEQRVQRAQSQPKGRGRGRGRGSARGRVGLGRPNFKQSSPIASPTPGTVTVQSRPMPHSAD